MSESETTVKNESFGQLFGLFGISSEQTEDSVISDQLEEGELYDTNEQLIENSEQNNGFAVDIKEPINENECIVCKKTEPKYRCPKCQTKTCSLICCKSHKIKFNCNGMRDKLSFIKLSEFSEQEFLSDYFFLEDIDRTIDNSGRERRSIISSKYILPKWIQKLVREARLRGTNLRIMPAGFKRRKQNSTCFMYSQSTIDWDIELKFIHALDAKDGNSFDDLLADDLVVSHSEFSSLKRRICENTKLSELLSEYIDSNDLIESYEQNRKLILYRNSGINGIAVLFRIESLGSKQIYFELDLNKTIKENLVRKTVIEFPTFLVILNKFKHLFDITTIEKRVKTE